MLHGGDTHVGPSARIVELGAVHESYIARGLDTLLAWEETQETPADLERRIATTSADRFQRPEPKP